MRIGIELNGVLRDTIGKMIDVYDKAYLSMEPTDKEDPLLKQYKAVSTSDGIEFDEIIEVESDFIYEFNGPVTSLNLMEHFKFRDKEELYSFLYEEFPMQIFGHASSVEYSSFNDLNDIYRNLRESHDILIVSDEIGKSKPSSSFFLSKFGCLIEKVKFYSNTTIESMWDEVDIIVTANPDIIQSHPDNKIVVKFKQEYNKQIQSKYEINKIIDLEEIINKIIND